MGFDRQTGGDVDDPSVDSVSTETIAVGTGSAVSGLWADSGELVPLHQTGYQSKAESASTTSSWSLIAAGDQEVYINWPRLTGFTNISAYYISFTVGMENNTASETTSLRVAQYPNVTASATGPGYDTTTSNRKEVTPPNSIEKVYMEMKVTAGTGSVRGAPGITVWGEIE